MMDNKNFNEENALRNAQPMSDEDMEQATGGYDTVVEEKCRYCGRVFRASNLSALTEILREHEAECAKLQRGPLHRKPF